LGSWPIKINNAEDKPKATIKAKTGANKVESFR
jgi:hypothetical protein